MQLLLLLQGHRGGMLHRREGGQAQHSGTPPNLRVARKGRNAGERHASSHAGVDELLVGSLQHSVYLLQRHVHLPACLARLVLGDAVEADECGSCFSTTLARPFSCCSRVHTGNLRGVLISIGVVQVKVFLAVVERPLVDVFLPKPVLVDGAANVHRHAVLLVRLGHARWALPVVVILPHPLQILGQTRGGFMHLDELCVAWETDA